MINVDNIVRFINELPVTPRRLLVAYSGGLDSTVLLHLLSRVHSLFASQSSQLTRSSNVAQQLETTIVIEAIHVNHNLSANASQWQEHCETQCETLNIPIYVESVVITVAGKGLEAAARQARYMAFEKHLDDETVLLTAHHADDQAETLLFRLARGTGLHGLSGIQRYRRLGDGIIARPLLTISRDDLERYAEQYKLSWVDDESNEDKNFSRNYIRHAVIPILNKRWPKTVVQFSASANHMADSQFLLNEYLQHDFIACDRKTERVGESISLHALQAFSLNKQAHILRYWLELLECKLPSMAVLEQIKNLLTAQSDAIPTVKLDLFDMRRFNNRLFLLPKSFIYSLDAARVSASYVLSENQNLYLPGDFCLSFKRMERSFVRGDTPSLSASFHIRFRQGGERARPQGRQHSQTLKKLLQEYKLEPWLRDIVPLIYRGDDLVAVGDLWIESDSMLPPDFFVWVYQGKSIS